MVEFQPIHSLDELNHLGKEWTDVPDFSLKNERVDEKGNILPINYKGHCYQLITKKERVFTTCEYIKRVVTGVFFLLFSLGSSREIQELFARKTFLLYGISCQADGMLQSTWAFQPALSWKCSLDQKNPSTLMRTKKGMKTVYSRKEEGMSGATSQVFRYTSPDKKEKVLKIGAVRSDLKVLQMIYSLSAGRKIPGIMIPPKAFFDDTQVTRACSIVLANYDRNLSQWIQKHQPSADESLKALSQVIQGLHFLHQNQIFHGDIKSFNILFREKKGMIRFDLADFGTAEKLPLNVEEFRSLFFCGTPGYLCVEDSTFFAQMKKTILTKAHLEKIGKFLLAKDIFALGVVVKELLCLKVTGDPSNLSRDEIDMFQIPEDLALLVNQMLDPNWEKRPNIEKVSQALQKHSI